MPVHWTHTCPPGSQIWTELDGDPDNPSALVVSCIAPGDPPPPEPPPNAAGTVAGQLGDDHFYSLDWELVDGQLVVHDLDVYLSLDDQAG